MCRIRKDAGRVKDTIRVMHWIKKNDRFVYEIDKEAIIRVSLLHDMGNIIKIPEKDLENEKTIELRRKFIEKYGEYEHYTNMAIAKELGLGIGEVKLVIDLFEGV